MADKTKIEWTDATWNPVTGCSLVSEGCRYCYAAALAASRLKNHPSRKGLAKRNAAGVAQFTGEVRFNEKWIDQPLSWRKPRRIFVCAHADLFHENVPDEWIDKVFAVMALCPQHTFQVLTKRPERMRKYLSDVHAARWMLIEGDASAMGFEPRGLDNDGFDWLANKGFLPNVWLGVSIEDQPTADTRIPYLLETPAAVRFVSAEPLLGAVDLTAVEWKDEDAEVRSNVLTAEAWIDNSCSASAYVNEADGMTRLDWVIVGGESGDHARAMDPQWARTLRDQCSAAGVPFLFKQWGVWAPRNAVPDLPEWNAPGIQFDVHAYPSKEGDARNFVWRIGKGRTGRLLDGVTHDGFPEACL